MYRLAGKDLGAKNFTTVMYEYEPNWTTKRMHTHDARESIYIILEGLAKVHLNGEEHELGPGMVVYLSPGDMHGVIGSGPEGMKMIEIWAPQDPDITYYEDGSIKCQGELTNGDGTVSCTDKTGRKYTRTVSDDG